MLLRHAIGRALRRLRKEQGKTLQALATAARVSMPYLSEIERGRKEASSEILATVCRALDISLAGFLAEVTREYSSVQRVTSIAEFTGRERVEQRERTEQYERAERDSSAEFLLAA